MPDRIEAKRGGRRTSGFHNQTRRASDWNPASHKVERRGVEGGKLNRLTHNVNDKWQNFKALFTGRPPSGDAVQLSTMTVPRALPLSPYDMYLCDECMQLNGQKNTATTRLCFRSISIGNESPIFLRELVPCERCTPEEDLRYHKFEASSEEIAKAQKRMSMLPKDVDWLQEFARIEVEKSRGKCTIRSNNRCVKDLMIP